MSAHRRWLRGGTACFLLCGSIAASGGEPAGGSARPSADPSNASTEAAPENRIRAAMDLLDRMESLSDAEERAPLLDELNRTLEVAQRETPNDPWLLFLRGRVHALNGRNGDAVTHLRRFLATREGRNDWRAHRLLGDLFVEEFPQLAKASYEKAAELITDEPSVLHGLSRCAMQLGRIEEAVTLARKACEAAPLARHCSYLVRLYLAQRRWADAQREAVAVLESAKQAVTAHPGVRTHVAELDAQYRLLIEVLQSRLGEPDASVDDSLSLAAMVGERAANATLLASFDRLRVIEAAVRKSGGAAPARLLEQYGAVLVEVGRREAAAAQFENLLKLDPANGPATYWLGRLRAEAGDSKAPNRP
ncbi:MAG: tetratricopeptide repeat protein [Planctomycetes bacterium]|nr:tetratricopeptide repeat protein [Planctomycetota bacterium]